MSFFGSFKDSLINARHDMHDWGRELFQQGDTWDNLKSRVGGSGGMLSDFKDVFQGGWHHENPLIRNGWRGVWLAGLGSLGNSYGSPFGEGGPGYGTLARGGGSFLNNMGNAGGLAGMLGGGMGGMGGQGGGGFQDEGLIEPYRPGPDPLAQPDTPQPPPGMLAMLLEDALRNNQESSGASDSPFLTGRGLA